MKYTSLLLCSLLLLVTGAEAMPKPENPQLAGAQLPVVKSRFFDDYRVDGSTNFAPLSRVYIQPASVEFDERWLRDHRHKVSNQYLSLTRDSYAQLLVEELTKAFAAQSRYQLVASAADADLILTPAISGLFLFGPEYTNITRTYVHQAGHARLEVQIKDNQDRVLAYMADRRETRNFGPSQMQIANRVTNYRDFQQLMRRWSSETLGHLAGL